MLPRGFESHPFRHIIPATVLKYIDKFQICYRPMSPLVSPLSCARSSRARHYTGRYFARLAKRDEGMLELRIPHGADMGPDGRGA